jgi:hypothetical protein
VNCRLKEGRGGVEAWSMAPFPFPDHQTGRADLPRRAFRPRAVYRGSSVARRVSKDVAPGKDARAAPANLAAPIEEAPDAVADAPIGGAVGCVQGFCRNTPTGRRAGLRDRGEPARVVLSLGALMARVARFVVPGLRRHVTQRGNRRETAFFSGAGNDDVVGQ